MDKYKLKLQNGEVLEYEVPKGTPESELKAIEDDILKGYMTEPSITETQQDPDYVDPKVLKEHFQKGQQVNPLGAFGQGFKRGAPVIGDIWAETGGDYLPGPVKPAVQRAYLAGQETGNPEAQLAGQLTGGLTAGAGTYYGAKQAYNKSGVRKQVDEAMKKLSKIPKFKWLGKIGKNLTSAPTAGPHSARITKSAALVGGATGTEQYARNYANAFVLDYYRKEDGSIDHEAIARDAGQAAATGLAVGGIMAPIASMINKTGEFKGLIDMIRVNRWEAQNKIRIQDELIDAIKRKDWKTLESFKKDPYKMANAFDDSFDWANEAVKAGKSVGGGAITGAVSKGLSKAIKGTTEGMTKAMALGGVQGAVMGALAYGITAIGKYALTKVNKGDWKRLLREAEMQKAKLVRELNELDRGMSSIPVLLGTEAAQTIDADDESIQNSQRWSK